MAQLDRLDQFPNDLTVVGTAACTERGFGLAFDLRRCATNFGVDRMFVFRWRPDDVEKVPTASNRERTGADCM